jgi:hypothetical protein
MELFTTYVEAIVEIARGCLDLDQVLWSGSCPDILIQIACVNEVSGEPTPRIPVEKVRYLAATRPGSHSSIFGMN